MDFDDMDIERLRRGGLAQDEPADPPDDERYRAFVITDTYQPQRRMIIRSNSLRRQVIPLYDLVYDIVTDLHGRFLCLIYPFAAVKIYGRNLFSLEVALTYHLCIRIDEFEPASDRFPDGTDEEIAPIVTAIVIEAGDEGHGMDAEAESRKYRATVEREEE